MAETPKKKERENKKRKNKKDKEEKMKERRENAKKGKTLNDMMAYLDENGNISSRPPDPRKKIEIKVEDIQIGVPQYVAPTKEELTHSGKVTFFNYEKGFGFIKDQVTQQSIFVHANNLSASINENDNVSFELENGHRGFFAVNVKLLS